MLSAMNKFLRSILLCLKHVLEKPAVQFILFIFYSLVIAYYSIEDFRAGINLYLPKVFSDYFFEKSIELVLLAIFLSTSPIILSFLKKLESNNLPSFNVLHAINIGFGQVVNHKATSRSFH